MALEENFDFNKTTLAPPFTKVVMYEKTGQQKSWDSHGVKIWYLVPDTEHYIFYTVYVQKTKAEHIAYAVEFPTEHHKMPVISNQKSETNTALDLIESIANQSPTATFAFTGLPDYKLSVIWQIYSNINIGIQGSVFVPKCWGQNSENNTGNPQQGDNTNEGGGQT